MFQGKGVQKRDLKNVRVGIICIYLLTTLVES